jgi:hypothetical protein
VLDPDAVRLAKELDGGSARGRENPQGESPCPQLSGALLAHNRSMVGPYKLDGTAGSAGS